jgi:hypothetical protein
MGRTTQLLLAILVFAGASCRQSDGPALYPVAGKVQLNGEGMDGALVVWHRQPALPALPPPSAQTRPDGAFQLTTWAAGDGAPEGEYLVSVVWPQAKPADVPGKPSGESKGEAPDRLRGRYRDANKSGLKFTVQPGRNEPILIELSSSAPK